jgi:hypothetical protein
MGAPTTASCAANDGPSGVDCWDSAALAGVPWSGTPLTGFLAAAEMDSTPAARGRAVGSACGILASPSGAMGAANWVGAIANASAADGVPACTGCRRSATSSPRGTIAAGRVAGAVPAEAATGSGNASPGRTKASSAFAAPAATSTGASSDCGRAGSTHAAPGACGSGRAVSRWASLGAVVIDAGPGATSTGGGVSVAIGKADTGAPVAAACCSMLAGEIDAGVSVTMGDATWADGATGAAASAS